MINIKSAQVKEIVNKRSGITEVIVEVGDKKEHAISFDNITPDIKVGDLVIINTIARDLGLGSGGVHFVIGILFKDYIIGREYGHLIKLRYTPYQFQTEAIEEKKEVREKILNFRSLDGIPVIIGELLSQVAPTCYNIKRLNNQCKVIYVMTDDAALPLSVSNLIHELKQRNLIDKTITCKQAFGGDYETVNIYTALICAKEVAEADIIIVTQGLGSVGTATKYGFSGVYQAEVINATNILGGVPILIPRISFADKRERHYGLSHHTITLLKELTPTPTIVCIPQLSENKLEFILTQLRKNKIMESHHTILFASGKEGVEALIEEGINVETMGRSIEEDKEFFETAAAASVIALEYLKLRK